MKRKPQHVSNILPANSWEGQRAFIIGGGPSLRDMSPEDREALTNEKVIGTNKERVEKLITLLKGMNIEREMR